MRAISVFRWVSAINGNAMKKGLYRGVLALPLILQGSVSQAAGAEAHNVEISALPVIQQMISSLVPLFDGKRNKVIMDQVCLYASGQQSQAQLDAFFTNKGIQVAQLAPNDSGFRFLASASQQALVTACAAFVASTFFTEEALVEGAGIQTNDPQLSDKLLRLTPLALVTVNALAGLLAAHQGEVFSNLDSYQKVLRQDFERQAAGFVSQTFKGNFVLSDYVANGRANGFYYTFAYGNARLNLYDDVWLGDGKVMGTRYVVYLKTNAPTAAKK